VQAVQTGRAVNATRLLLNLSEFPPEGQRSLFDWRKDGVKTCMLWDETGGRISVCGRNNNGGVSPLLNLRRRCLLRPRSAGGREPDYAGPML
jgi:hypothetical protein